MRLTGWFCEKNIHCSDVSGASYVLAFKTPAASTSARLALFSSGVRGLIVFVDTGVTIRERESGRE